jgi:hypothetical protein
MVYWILQANPDRYRIYDALRDGYDIGSWRIAQFRNEITPGDKFALWVSGAERGVYALGIVTESAEYALRDAPDPYWTNPAEGNSPMWRVGIRIDENRISNPILCDELAQDPDFADALILRMPGGKNPFRLTDSQWHAMLSHRSPATSRRERPVRNRPRARVRGFPQEEKAAAPADRGGDTTNLLLRIYIPSERLYAAEANRLLSLFRDWLIATRGHGVRQAGYRTASGEMYEFFADASVVQSDLHEEFDRFSEFLTLCSENPSAAVAELAPTRFGRALGADLVARFGKEVRRLQIDLRHERERRILTIRHGLEEELLERGTHLPEGASSQINILLERLVPSPTAPESLALLAVPWTARPTTPVTVNINPQIISAMESTIIQNVQGVINLGPQAKEFLALISRFGGQEATTLESAVYELEDPAAPPSNKSVAKRRLKKFLSQVAGTAHDVAVDLLEKYLESRLGL